MSIENYRPGEISSLGKAIYQKKIKHLVEPQENGKFIVPDVESGDYELDEASVRLRERRPNASTHRLSRRFASNATSIGEHPMIPIVEERVGELQQLCIRHRVLRLDLFGSAATGNYQGRESDLDFLVEFQTLPSGEYADAYFGLLEALELLFGHPVDLVVDSAIKNPFFRQRVDETRTLLYAA